MIRLSLERRRRRLEALLRAGRITEQYADFLACSLLCRLRAL